MSQYEPVGSSTICAFGIPGVRTYAVDTDDGMDITLVTVGDAAELRRRLHDAMQGTGRYLAPETAAIARRAHVQIDDHTTGLTMHVRPIDPNELDSLRLAIHRRLEQLTTLTCNY